MSSSPVPGSAIPIIAHDRADEEPLGRRHLAGASRGLTSTTIERGVSAVQAIKEANDKTERFHHELDRTRAQLGRATDAVREHELCIKARGLASEQVRPSGRQDHNLGRQPWRSSSAPPQGIYGRRAHAPSLQHRYEIQLSPRPGPLGPNQAGASHATLLPAGRRVGI